MIPEQRTAYMENKKRHPVTVNIPTSHVVRTMKTGMSALHQTAASSDTERVVVEPVLQYDLERYLFMHNTNTNYL